MTDNKEFLEFCPKCDGVTTHVPYKSEIFKHAELCTKCDMVWEVEYPKSEEKDKERKH